MISFLEFLLQEAGLRNPLEISQFQADISNTKTVDSRDDSWRRNLDRYMNSLGFSLYGSGKYGSVYGSENYRYAIKVFMKDSAYLKWVKFSIENKDNPYVPKFKGKIIKFSEIIHMIKMEKLTNVSYSHESFNNFFSEYRKWLNDNTPSSNQYLQDIFDFFGNNKDLLDIHGENVMYRASDDQLVIVDPFYNWFGRREPGKFTIDPNDSVSPDLYYSWYNK